jgi:hypothetical protein
MPATGYPEWTEYRKKNGLDPLGMQNTSVALYQRLLPGISNVTLRMRYYGLYAWLSAVYARRIGDTDPKTWQRFVRRAEALYALAAQTRGGEGGIAGILWAQRKLSGTDASSVDFAGDAEPGSPTYYLKQAWGAFGAAYQSQLFEIGVFSEVTEHAVPVPSPDIGDEMAARFEAACGYLATRFIEAIERGNVTRDELGQFAPMTPGGIGTDDDERLLYERVLFAEAGQQRSTDLDRRRTMLLILELARQLGRSPDVGDVRWAFYSGCLPDGEPLQFPVGLDHQQGRWWIYQANDLAHICFETLLKFLLDLLEPHPSGLTPGALIGQAVAEIVATAEDRPETWSEFLRQTTPAANAASDEVPLAERMLTEAVLRAGRAGDEQQCPPEAAWQALQLLAVLCKRTEVLDPDRLSELAEFENGAFRSLLTEVRFLRAHRELPFDQLLARLLEERVLRRHLWIALRKLRYQNDYTFLFEPDNGRIRLRAKDGPVFTNPRLGPALTFIRDVHLLDEAGLTPLGQRRIAQT